MSSMDDLIQRIKNQSKAKEYKAKAKATEVAKRLEADQIEAMRPRRGQPKHTTAVEAVTAKRTKPMPNGRTTRNNTHMESYSDTQIAAALDAAQTMQEVYPCILEVRNRLRKGRDTLGNIVLEKFIQNRYEQPPQYHQPETEYEEPEYEEEPPPPPPVSLTWDIIKEIEADQCAYAPYLTEIWYSDWDYKDRRPKNVPMGMSQEKAKDWTDTHRNDDGCTRSHLSDYQAGFIMVLLKAYHYHKSHPDVQRRAAMAEEPPF